MLQEEGRRGREKQLLKASPRGEEEWRGSQMETNLLVKEGLRRCVLLSPPFRGEGLGNFLPGRKKFLLAHPRMYRREGNKKGILSLICSVCFKVQT